MTTVVVKGVENDVDPAAESWLATTSLAGNSDAALRLSRAVSPRRHGFGGREPLDLAAEGICKTAILDLLLAEQVPTPAAVATAVARAPSLGVRRERRQALRLQAERYVGTVRADRGALGEVMSSAVALHWIDHGVGPTWREAWEAKPVLDWWAATVGDPPPFWGFVRNPVFAMLHGSAWLASNRVTRSMCPGRQFYVRFYGDHVSGRSAHTVGLAVARSIDKFRRRNDFRSPTWEDMAASATDPYGVPLFFNVTDAQAQQRWLITEGWLRLMDGELRCGTRAHSEIRSREVLEHAVRRRRRVKGRGNPHAKKVSAPRYGSVRGA